MHLGVLTLPYKVFLCWHRLHDTYIRTRQWAFKCGVISQANLFCFELFD